MGRGGKTSSCSDLFPDTLAMGKGKTVSAGDKMTCPPLCVSPSPPGLAVIWGKFSGPFSMAGTLLGEPARLFAHLASPGPRREDGWAEMGEHRGSSCFLPIFH